MNKPNAGWIRGFIDRCLNLLSRFSSKKMYNHKETIKEFQGLKRRLVGSDLHLQALYAEAAGLVGIAGPKEEIIQVMMDEKDVSAQQLNCGIWRPG